MEVRAKWEGCYSELKIHLEIANFVSLTTLINIKFWNFITTFALILVY